jgi:hypothetical protein
MDSQLLAQLKDSSSEKRASAAKKIGKLNDGQYCNSLITALGLELKDERTWKAQYQLILALGFCGCDCAMSVIEDLALKMFKNTILYDGIGDAFCRIYSNKFGIDEAIKRLHEMGNLQTMKGGLRAMALCGLRPSDDSILALISLARESNTPKLVCGYPGDDSGLRLWIIVAAFNWGNQAALDFAKESLSIKNSQVKLACQSILNGKKIKWAPY